MRERKLKPPERECMRGVMCDCNHFILLLCSSSQVSLSSFPQFSSDDVVGCVELRLERLRHEGQLDTWEPIVLPRIPSTLDLLGRLWQGIAGPKQQAELKLTLKVEGGSNVGCNGSKDHGQGNIGDEKVVADVVINPSVGGDAGGGVDSDGCISYAV